MLTFSPAMIYTPLFCLIATTFGFSTSVFPTLNYCTPIVVKENISIEKLQIGTWVATQPNATVPFASFGGTTPSYDFSLQGVPLTRDTFYWQIWVDLNGDLDFDDQGENLLKVATPRKQKASGHLTLPEPFNGNLSVRVMLSRSKANNPCGTLAKVMDYYDFSIQEAYCPEVNVKQQLKVGQVSENEAILSFDLPTNTLVSWQIKKSGQDWASENTFTGYILTLKELQDSSSYAFRYRLQCKDLTWSAWSDAIGFITKSKPKQPCLKPSLDSIAIFKPSTHTVNLTYLGKTHHKVTWNYAADRQCDAVLDTTKKDFQISYKNGERIWVRLKGLCASGEVSSFSDTLWFERPCVGTDTSKFFFANITQESAVVRVQVGDWCSRGYFYYLTTDTTLHESLWTTLPDAGDGNITLKNLLPGTDYFLKISNRCYNEEGSVFFSGFKPFKTLAKDQCPAPSLDSVKIIFTNHYNINLTYTGKEHSKVTWNYPSYYQECSLKSDTTKREIDIWYKNGERVSIRLKGVCASGEVSPFSDRLWFERPCVQTDTSRLYIKNITDKSARIVVGIGDFCSYGYTYYLTTDTTLHDSLWTKLRDNRGDYSTLQNLLHNTRYFIKFRGYCEAQNIVYFSKTKSFKTHPKLTQCPTVDGNEVHFRNFQGNYIWVSVRSNKVSAGRELVLEDVSGYQSTTTYSFLDSLSISTFVIGYTDTEYQIKIKNKCGELESPWSKSIPFTITAPCARINPLRLRHTFENNQHRITYMVNPELPIAGPYLWRYRVRGVWVDTLISEANFMEFPASLSGEYVTFSVIPVASLTCGNSYWSEYALTLQPCSALRDNGFGLKSMTSNTATFYIQRDRVPTHVKLRYRNAGFSDGTNPFVEVDPTATEVTVSKLEPNAQYIFWLCNDCQIGTSKYSSCTSYFYITTPKSSFQPEETLSLARASPLTGMKLVPNPSNGLFNVELPTQLEGTAILSITNLNGQVIQRNPIQLFPGARPALDLSQQAQGVYFIHLQLGKQVYREKLVQIR